MAPKIFYSWQSYLPNSTNRGLIKKALDDAVAVVPSSLEEADRPVTYEVDQDTQGVPGSPPIFETILRKIRDSEILIADVTTSVIGDERRSPNPNVLIEYGYALSHLGDERILPVFNTAFGDVNELPFDLRGKRVLKYHAPPGDGEAFIEERRKARKHLAGMIEPLLSTMPPTAPVAEEPKFARAQPRFVSSGFVTPTELLGVDADEWAVNGRSSQLAMEAGPQAFVRLVPLDPQEELTRTDVEQIVRQSQVRPFAPSGWGTTSIGRGHLGAFVFSEPGPNDADRTTVQCLSQVFRTREIWGINSLSLAHATEDGTRYIPCDGLEQQFLKALTAYRALARGALDVRGPLHAIVGMCIVEGYRLSVGMNETRGYILDNEIVSEFAVDTDADINRGLEEFFRRYWDSAGVIRSSASA